MIESHPDNALTDFRLDCPFPELSSYMDSQDLDSMTQQQHSHTPYLVILYKCLQQWKKTHDGKGPLNYKEKKAFKELVLEGKKGNHAVDVE